MTEYSLDQVLSFPSVPIEEINLLPETSGVYFILQEDSCLYVGKSINLKSRLFQHPKFTLIGHLNNLRIAYYRVDKDSLVKVKNRFIDSLNPEMNLSQRVEISSKRHKHKFRKPVLLLSEMLEMRKMSMYRLSKLTGIHYQVLMRLDSGEAKAIRFENLDKICNTLECYPGEIINWPRD
jgi:putative transcriptional regulator